MLQVSLYRYNPETDEAPYMQDFSVDTGGRDFMVLDVLLLYVAFQTQYRQSDRGQEITISTDEIEIKYFKAGTCIKTILFNRYWAKLEHLNTFNRHSKLMFSSHGKFSEIGEFLSFKEKQKLAADLKPLLANGDYETCE